MDLNMHDADLPKGSEDSGNSAESFAYDQVPYLGSASEFLHLRNLEVVGQMFGMSPASIANCRVLELGCADGTNLLPYALEFPESEFVGVDLATNAISKAREVAVETKLFNTTFHQKNIRDIDTSIGKFDYILCPGIFSWVTAEERLSLLRICRDCLTDTGMAVVSYNTFPGWNLGGALRDFMRRYAGAHTDPARQIAVAREATEFIAAHANPKSPHGQFYASARDRLRGKGDAYLYHDYLSDRNQPFYFHEFEQIATEHQLKFVAEADFKQSSGFGLDQAGRAAMSQVPPSDREQLLDFLLNTFHRRSILSHAGFPLNQTIQHEVISEVSIALVEPLAGLSVDPLDGQAVNLNYKHGSVTLTNAFVKAAIKHLMDQWPVAITVDALFDASQKTLGAGLVSESESLESLSRTLLAFYAAGLVKVFKTDPVLVDRVSDKPQVSSLTRLVAAKGLVVVNQWHQDVMDLSDSERFLLGLLDGTRDFGQLMSQWIQYGGPADSAAETVKAMLDHFLRDRLLIA